MRVAIVGSREGFTFTHVEEFVGTLKLRDVVVSGGARGVDSWAEEAARARGMAVDIYPAAWARYGKSAGFVRNQDIVENCDRLVAFWNGESRGTMNTVDIAMMAGKPVLIIYPNRSLESRPA